MNSKNILCLLSFHLMSKWEYVKDHTCKMTSACRREGYEYIKMRIRHFLVVPSDTLCNQILKCVRCGSEESGRIHAWKTYEGRDEVSTPFRGTTSDFDTPPPLVYEYYRSRSVLDVAREGKKSGRKKVSVM